MTDGGYYHSSAALEINNTVLVYCNYVKTIQWGTILWYLNNQALITVIPNMHISIKCHYTV